MLLHKAATRIKPRGSEKAKVLTKADNGQGGDSSGRSASQSLDDWQTKERKGMSQSWGGKGCQPGTLSSKTSLCVERESDISGEQKMTQSVKCSMFKPGLGALAPKSKVGCGSIHLQSQRWEGRSKGSQGFAAQLVQSNQETPGSVRGPVS